MKFFDKLNPFIFFLSFCIGIFVCYITSPVPQIIIKYPEADDIMSKYIDKESNCFRYVKKEVSCPKNEDEIINI